MFRSLALGLSTKVGSSNKRRVFAAHNFHEFKRPNGVNLYFQPSSTSKYLRR